MKLLNVIFILCALIFLLPETARSVSAGFIENIAKVHIKDGSGNTVEAIVLAQNYSPAFPYKVGFRWGSELRPKVLIISIDLMVGGKKIFIPLSAYSDLTNPNRVSLDIIEGGLRVLIEGGSASTSYNAELIFKSGFIQRRKVTHGEFPDVAWEETVYSFNTLNN